MILADAPAGSDLWHQWLSVQFDAAHLLSELGFTLVFDFLLIFVLWGKLIKPYLDRRFASQHHDLDVEHGIVDHGLSQKDTLPREGDKIKRSDGTWLNYDAFLGVWMPVSKAEKLTEARTRAGRPKTRTTI